MAQTRCGDRILPLVTAPEVREQNLVGHRYFVGLVSRNCELQDDHAVPVRTQTVNVVVTQPTHSALAKLNETIAQPIATCDWLKDYSIVSYNEPSFDRVPF